MGARGPRASDRVAPCRSPTTSGTARTTSGCRIDGTTATLGITDYAQDALGDVVFVTLPDVGATVAAGASLGEVESTKSVSEIYAPVAGTVLAVNEALRDAPEVS